MPLCAFATIASREGREALRVARGVGSPGPIKRTAALMAGHGFVVAVPEIFHELEAPGTEIPYDQAGADIAT